MELLQIIVNSIQFPFFNCYQISQLNCRVKRLLVSPQHMTLLVKIMLTTSGKSFFTLTEAFYFSFNDTIRSINYNNSFLQLFHEFKRLCPICKHLKKRYKKCLPFCLQLRTAVFQEQQKTLFHRNIVLPPKKSWFGTGVN